MVSKHRELEKNYDAEIHVNGKKLALNHSVQETVANLFVGFLKTLKEVDEPENIIFHQNPSRKCIDTTQAKRN